MLQITPCKVRWIFGLLCLIAPSAVLSTYLLGREASLPVLERCRLTSLGALLILILGLTSGIVVIFGCQQKPSSLPPLSGEHLWKGPARLRSPPRRPTRGPSP